MKKDKKNPNKKTYSFEGVERISVSDFNNVLEGLTSSPFLSAYALIPVGPSGDPGCGPYSPGGDGGNDGGPPYC